jgi:tetratricopeptide (TPR) repeat protein
LKSIRWFKAALGFPSTIKNQQSKIFCCREAKMKRNLTVLGIALLLMGLALPPVFAQGGTGSVKGVCKDAQGNPIADAIVVYANTSNGQKFTLKTNKKGEYFSLGVTPGIYIVTLYKNADDVKANKEVFHFNKFQVVLDENKLDFDLKQQSEDAAKGQGLTPEQIKEQQEKLAKQQKEQGTVKNLNEKLAAANTAIQAGDFDATRDLIWFKLGDAYRLSAPKQTDPAEKQKRFDSAIASYQKAIQLRQSAPPDKDAATAAKNLAAYYNNLAEAYAKAGKTDDAVKTYAQAVQADPTGAASFYFNTGAVLTNAGKLDDAVVAFDKVIAADPNRADAYYWKGVNMIGKATLQGDKMVAPPGTAEAFQKYLELQPTGTYADPSKQMLASIGASIETSYGTKKKAVKK